jgi:hypothetical protein
MTIVSRYSAIPLLGGYYPLLRQKTAASRRSGDLTAIKLY